MSRFAPIDLQHGQSFHIRRAFIAGGVPSGHGLDDRGDLANGRLWDLGCLMRSVGRGRDAPLGAEL
jgi:hypothetical protein